MEHHRKRSLRVGRRSFLGHAGLFTTTSVVAGMVGSPFAAKQNPASAQSASAQTASAQTAELNSHEQFRLKARQVRVKVADENYQVAIPPHPTNGDEERYANKIGSDSRALPHNERGEVDLQAFQSAVKAYTTGDPNDFEQIILGGTRKQLNPIGSLAVSLTGCNATQLAIPPAPRLDSPERAAEAVELYWNALLRDVSFAEFQDNTSNPLVLAAIEEINQLVDFRGPKLNGRVTPQILFRGSVTYADLADPTGQSAIYVIPPGVLEGPYISQFLLRDIPVGPQVTSPLIQTALPGNDFQVEYEEWLTVQNGNESGKKIQFDSTGRYISTPRDLAEFVHNAGALFGGAAAILGTKPSPGNLVVGGIGAPFNPSNPYVNSKTQAGGASTFGLAYVQGLLPSTTSRAIRVAYWQKFYVHRTLRPEAYGGLVHHNAANRADYPIHSQVLNSQALARSFSKFGTYLLPQAYPEGAPIHPSYPGGAAIIAGAHATLLKALFDENFVIPDPVVPDPNDPTKVIPYTGAPLTVGGELNKLALNYAYGRNAAGIHWRSDAAASLALGEALAISILRDEKATYRENFGGFTFTKFDGTKVTI
ncbi:vanadium-dependent haloperoxidase [Leptolyngbya sp. NK1-12]|uniref:Vanadium-dependent haloperoxidase n=1 Tax=Leptolyngbya sp. NK1-12 TaxID=2547451 RepID=A0AA96WLN0_9CYAN|nr:vanadium-dependent haloperoxidase [Leptolyngbya sp. NK1-12]